MMPKVTHKGASGTAWLWVALLCLFFFLVIAWFADPLGYADQARPARAASSTEWTVAPEGPAVPVTLPQVRVKASQAAAEQPRTGADKP
jgi:hypothetical protein